MSPTYAYWLHQSALLLMALTLICCLLIGVLFFFKRSGHKWGNRAFGALLMLGGLTQFHYCLDFGGYFLERPNWRFYPLYFNLWLPVLLFYYIKLTLFPRYRPRYSDLKHLALPVGQLLYFLLLWLVPSLRHPDGRWFYSPFYGGLEQALFLFGLPLYLIFSFQYFRRSVMRNRSGSQAPAVGVSHRGYALNRTQWYVRHLMRGSLLFWIIYAAVALVDFFAFKFWAKDLRDLAWFAAAGALSFSGLLFWWCTYGFQVLIWGRNLRIGWRPGLKSRGQAAQGQPGH